MYGIVFQRSFHSFGPGEILPRHTSCDLYINTVHKTSIQFSSDVCIQTKEQTSMRYIHPMTSWCDVPPTYLDRRLTYITGLVETIFIGPLAQVVMSRVDVHTVIWGDQRVISQPPVVKHALIKITTHTVKCLVWFLQLP